MNHPLSDDERTAFAAYIDTAEGTLNVAGRELLNSSVSGNTPLKRRLIFYCWELAGRNVVRMAILCCLSINETRSMLKRHSLRLIDINTKERMRAGQKVRDRIATNTATGDDLLDELADDLVRTAAIAHGHLREQLELYDSLTELTNIIKITTHLALTLKGKPTSITKGDYTKKTEKGSDGLEELERELEITSAKVQEFRANRGETTSSA